MPNVASRDGTISVIATATNIVVAAVSGLAYPAEVAITPNGAYAYVTTATESAVAVIATATSSVVATVPVESWPIGLAVTPDGAYAYLANQFSNSVSVIATATNTVMATVPVGSDPAWVAFIMPTLPSTTSALSIAATPSSSPSYQGSPVTFTAAVSDSTDSAVPTGTVISGSTVLGTGALNNSVATYTTRSLAAGTY
jgi:YVTN family beta-propeller protein